MATQKDILKIAASIGRAVPTGYRFEPNQAWMGALPVDRQVQAQEYLAKINEVLLQQQGQAYHNNPEFARLVAVMGRLGKLPPSPAVQGGPVKTAVDWRFLVKNIHSFGNKMLDMSPEAEQAALKRLNAFWEKQIVGAEALADRSSQLVGTGQGDRFNRLSTLHNNRIMAAGLSGNVWSARGHELRIPAAPIDGAANQPMRHIFPTDLKNLALATKFPQHDIAEFFKVSGEVKTAVISEAVIAGSMLHPEGRKFWGGVKENLFGGKADGKKDKAFNKKQLQAGAKEEREHTKSPALAKEIAKDHLAQDKNYYKKLKKYVEKDAAEKCRERGRKDATAFIRMKMRGDGEKQASKNVRDALFKVVASGKPKLPSAMNFLETRTGAMRAGAMARKEPVPQLIDIAKKVRGDSREHLHVARETTRVMNKMGAESFSALRRYL